MLMDKLNNIINTNDNSSVKCIISHFIKNNLSDIPNMSIDYMALSCHTSKSQISKYIHNLGYETMKDFKEACIDYISGIERTNKPLLSLNEDIKKDYISFSNHMTESFLYTINKLDINQLEKLIIDIQKSKRVFVYAHGHARTLCSYIQNELSMKHKETIICDVDFSLDYDFNQEDILLLISINGDTFSFEKRVMHHILKSSVNTWLLTCKNNINFNKNYLYIPSKNYLYNDYVARHIIDFILRY